MVAKHSRETPLVPGLDPGAIEVVFGRQIDLWCKTQSTFLSAWQDMADSWFEHRLQGINAARDTFGAMCSCRDLGEMAALQQKFLTGAFDRLSADARALAESAVVASRRGTELMAENSAAASHLTETAGWKIGRSEKAAGTTSAGHKAEKATVD